MRVRLAVFLALWLVSPSFGQASYDQLISQARKQIEGAQYPAAVLSSRQAIALDKARWEGYLVEGLAENEQRHFDPAVAAFARALTFSPPDRAAGVQALLEKAVIAKNGGTAPGTAGLPLAAAAPAGSAGAPYFADPQTNLMWVRRDNGSDVDWYAARVYCRNLRVGGFGDWRLPLNEELGQIYDPSSNAPRKVRGGIIVTGYAWSATNQGFPTKTGKSDSQAWYFSFGNGSITAGRVEDSRGGRALCVRAATP